MGEIRVLGCAPAQRESWDAFVARSDGGTIFHRLAFLAYHGERFGANEHHVVWMKGETLFGVMPMAVVEEAGQRIALSPYGASYGGPVFSRTLGYSESVSAVSALLDYLGDINVVGCRLTLPLSCCSGEYSETFRLALMEHGFISEKRDISSVVSLSQIAPITERMSSRARNMVRKAEREGIEVRHRGSIADFWTVLEMTFAKHGTQATHSREEFEWLAEEFPESVYVDVAYLDDGPVAGVGYIATNARVNASFYFCQNPEFQSRQGLSLLVHDGLLRSTLEGYEWFDFGTSSIDMRGRDNIFRFKESFAAIGLFRETFGWQRASAAPCDSATMDPPRDSITVDGPNRREGVK